MPLGRGVAATVWFSSSTASCASRHCWKPSAAVFMIRLAVRDASLESAMLVAATTPRGFTGHEGLEDAGLAHMNGHVCDPALGRCLSADPFVLRPTTSRARNRDAYAFNQGRGARSRKTAKVAPPPPRALAAAHQSLAMDRDKPSRRHSQASSGAGRRIPFALVWAVQAGADACPLRGREPDNALGRGMRRRGRRARLAARGGQRAGGVASDGRGLLGLPARAEGEIGNGATEAFHDALFH